MALWTPYAEEALDLSRATVKQERLSPMPPETIGCSPPRFYRYASPISPPTSQHFLPQLPHTVPGARISPDPVNWTYAKSLGPSPPQSPELYDVDSLAEDVEYQAFERDALRAMAEKNGGCLLGNNPRMRRAVQSTQAADDTYRRQRERNNHAAKQSRDRRKLREVRLAFQVTFLRKKLAELRARLGERFCARCQQHCQC